MVNLAGVVVRIVAALLCRRALVGVAAVVLVSLAAVVVAGRWLVVARGACVVLARCRCLVVAGWRWLSGRLVVAAGWRWLSGRFVGHVVAMVGRCGCCGVNRFANRFVALSASGCGVSHHENGKTYS